MAQIRKPDGTVVEVDENGNPIGSESLGGIPGPASVPNAAPLPTPPAPQQIRSAIEDKSDTGERVAPTAQSKPEGLLRPETSNSQPQQQVSLQRSPVALESGQVSSQTIVTGGKDTRPLVKAAEAAKQVNTEGGLLAGNRAAAAAEDAEAAAILAGKQQDELKINQDARDVERAKGLAKVQKAVDETAAFQFDSNRFFKRAGTSGVVLAGVGAVIGALAQGFGAKSNSAIDAVNKAIDKDLEQQKQEYQALKDKASAEQWGYGALVSQLKDKDAAEKEFKAQALANFKAKAEAQLNKLYSPLEASQKAAELNAAIDGRLAEQKVQAQGTTTKTTQTQKAFAEQQPKAGEKLPSESIVKLGFLDTTLNSLRKMKAELKKDNSAYSFVGDSPFTRELSAAAENYGRFQSGGVINKEEEANFKSRLRSIGNQSLEARLAKIEQLEEETLLKRDRLTNGFIAPPPPNPAPEVSVDGKKR